METVNYLSIVIPVYNEEESINLLYIKIRNVCNSLKIQYEIVFVDDGSSDATFDILRGIHLSDAHVRVIKFRRNSGQTSAMSAGFEYATGKVIISMDGDLQNDPEDIPRLLKKIDEGYDVICGWRRKRKDKLISRRIPSIAANWMISVLTGVKIHDNGCSLKAFRAHIMNKLPLYSEMHRFIPAMAYMRGARITEIVVKHHSRRFGYAKYGISRVWRVFFDLFIIKMLVGFSSRPALWFGVLSLPWFVVAILFLVLSLVSYFEPSGVSGSSIVYPSISLLIFFLAFQLNALGIFSELVLRTGHSEQFHEIVEIE